MIFVKFKVKKVEGRQPFIKVQSDYQKKYFVGQICFKTFSFKYTKYIKKVFEMKVVIAL